MNHLGTHDIVSLAEKRCQDQIVLYGKKLSQLRHEVIRLISDVKNPRPMYGQQQRCPCCEQLFIIGGCFLLILLTRSQLNGMADGTLKLVLEATTGAPLPLYIFLFLQSLLVKPPSSASSPMCNLLHADIRERLSRSQEFTAL